MSCHVHVVLGHVLSSLTSRATHVSASHYVTSLANEGHGHCFSPCMVVACHLHGFAVFCEACHFIPVWRSPFNLPVSPLLSYDVIWHHDSKLVDACHFLTDLDSSWRFLACYPFHCFSACMSLPTHFFLDITQLLLASSCECVPIASSVFHCMRRFLFMICPRIMSMCAISGQFLTFFLQFLACYPFPCFC